MKRVYKVLYILAILVLLAIFLYSAVSLYTYFKESKESQDKYGDLIDILEQNRPTATQPPAPSTGPGNATAPTGTTASVDTQPTEPPSPYVTVTDPDTGEAVELFPEFAELYQLNNDLIGWIRIDNTTVNYPVVHKPESTDYYLRRDFFGDRDNHGCIYIREECDAFAPSDNITIYGHRMKDGTMFADLAKYENKSYWEQNPYIQFDTLTERHTYQIISVFKTTATMGEGFRYHLFVDAEGKKDFVTFMAKCHQLEFYDTGITAELGDKLITLSTCEYTQENGRFVVVAKRIS